MTSAASRLAGIAGHLREDKGSQGSSAPTLLSQSAAAAALQTTPSSHSVQERERSTDDAVGSGAPLYSQPLYEKITKDVDAFNSSFGLPPWKRDPKSMTLYDPKLHGTGRWKFSDDEWATGVLTIEERDFYEVNGGSPRATALARLPSLPFQLLTTPLRGGGSREQAT